MASSDKCCNYNHTLSSNTFPYYRIRIPYYTSCINSPNCMSHNSRNMQRITTSNTPRNTLNHKIHMFHQLSERSQSMFCKCFNTQCILNYLNNTHLRMPRMYRFHCTSYMQFHRLSNSRSYTLNQTNIHTQNLIDYQCTCSSHSSSTHTASNNCCRISLSCRTSKYSKGSWVCQCNRMTSLEIRMHHRICRWIPSL